MLILYITTWIHVCDCDWGVGGLTYILVWLIGVEV